MLKNFLATLILFLVFVPNVSGYETLNTLFVEGEASMVMDGILDDWEPYNLPEIQVINPIEKTRDTAEIISTHSEDDCSFSFQCFADQKFVYFALIVMDDEVIMGKNDFGYGWLEDSNTLYFDGDCIDIEKPYFDANDGQLKVIGNPPNNIRFIEGDTPYFLKVIPYFWEARGILTGFQMTDKGYVTEIAIPVDVLGWDTVTTDSEMGANLRVVDMDSDANPEDVDKGYIWAPDPDHSAHVCTKSYNRISFSTSVPPVSSPSQATSIIQTDGGISVTLGMPDITKGRALLNDVLVDLAISDFESAETKLLPIQNELWVKPLLGMIQLKNGNIETATDNLIDFQEQSSYPWVTEWVNYILKEGAIDLLQSYMGSSIMLSNTLFEKQYRIFKRYIEHYPNDIEAIIQTGKWASTASYYNESIAFYEQALQYVSEDESYYIKLQIARNHFYAGQYDKAINSAKELMNSNIPDDIAFQASLIELSINAQ